MRFGPEIAAVVAVGLLSVGTPGKAAAQTGEALRCANITSQSRLTADTLVLDDTGKHFATIDLKPTGAQQIIDSIDVAAPDAFLPQTTRDTSRSGYRGITVVFTRTSDGAQFRVTGDSYPHGRGSHVGTCRRVTP